MAHCELNGLKRMHCRKLFCDGQRNASATTKEIPVFLLFCCCFFLLCFKRCFQCPVRKTGAQCILKRAKAGTAQKDPLPTAEHDATSFPSLLLRTQTQGTPLHSNYGRRSRDEIARGQRRPDALVRRLRTRATEAALSP